MQFTFDDLTNDIYVNGPDHRGAQMPAQKDLAINECNLPDNMRCKECTIEPAAKDNVAIEGLKIDYVTQDGFGNSDFISLLTEVSRLAESIGATYGFTNFAIRLNAECRFGRDDGCGSAILIYDNGKVNVETLYCPSEYNHLDDYEDEEDEKEIDNDFYENNKDDLNEAQINELNKKKQKGVHFNPNAGDVEKNIKFFNHVNGTDNCTTCETTGEAMAENISENNSNEKPAQHINIRSALNDIDKNMDQPCLLNLYDSIRLTDEQKLKIANMLVSDNTNINDIYEYMVNIADEEVNNKLGN